MKNTLFIKVSMQAVIGAFLGIISGFILGLLIWCLASLAMYITKSYDAPPGVMLPILGMCFGAIFGALYGGGTATREQNK